MDTPRFHLVDTWLEMFPSTDEARVHLNAALKTAYTARKLREWRQGVSTPGVVVIALMLEETLPVELAKAGLGAEAVDQVVARLRIP